ncbi:MAG: F0F1 ATP synthase subunit A [Holosporales bacterium]|jgi:F-type H+-transporting ATPase subunit a|nr:F0F1 ATP synthase subunit A [Holosporales bacterium]
MSSFEVCNVLPLSIGGFDISITNSSIFMMLVVAIVCCVLWHGTANKNLVPTRLQVVVEKLFFFIGGIVSGNVENRGLLIFPYIMVLFLFIMIGNVLGLLPFAFSFTSQLIVTVGMATAVFIASVVVGICTQGRQYFRHFCPDGIPRYMIPFFIIIETMSFLFRPLSLGIRLFANMVSGHIMIKVVAGFASSIAGTAKFAPLAIFPIAFDTLMNIFKLAVCVLQAYVFVTLSCMYMAESLGDSSHRNKKGV